MLRLDAAEQVLLSERVYRLLDYHPVVEKWQGGNLTKGPAQTTAYSTTETAGIPVMKVSAVKSVCILPHQSVVCSYGDYWHWEYMATRQY